MPAIITHHLFGQDIFDRSFEKIGNSRDEYESFMIGCQGPDILFFGYLDPTILPSWGLGSKLHKSNATDVLKAFADAIGILPEELKPIGQNYLYGLIAHFMLDKEMHPFIFAQQYAICDAGIDGLDRENGHEVHAEIESELDIMVLSTKLDMRISDFKPYDRILKLSYRASYVISLIYKNVAESLFGLNIPITSFSSSLRSYRLALSAIYSPYGIKRALIGKIERLFREHSFIQAMSHKNQLIYESIFDNHEHDEWKNPFTDELSNRSFWDIYDSQLERTIEMIDRFDGSDDSIFAEIARDYDFNGEKTTPTIISIEEISS